jgi:hypothetical protein
MKPVWVTVVARPAVGLLAREVRAEMTAPFAVTAAPAPGAGLVRMNNQDAAYAGRHLFAAGQAATAAVTKPLRMHNAPRGLDTPLKAPPRRRPKRTGRWPRRAAEEPDAGRHGNHADRDPPARLPLPARDAGAQTDGNARALRSTVRHRCLTVQLNT